MYIHYISEFRGGLNIDNLILKIINEEEKYFKDIIWLLNHTNEFVNGVSSDYIDYSDKFLDQDYLKSFGERNNKTSIVDISEIYWNLYVFIVNLEKINPGNSHVMMELEEEFMINYRNLKSLSREFLKYILPKMATTKTRWGYWDFRRIEAFSINKQIKKDFVKFVKNIDYHYDCAIAKDIIE